MKLQNAMYLPLLLAASTTGGAPALDIPNRASQTTELGRKLVVQKLGSISRMNKCRLASDREKFDLDQVRIIASRVQFYNADSLEGDLAIQQLR